jgi:hypothetical protein
VNKWSKSYICTLHLAKHTINKGESWLHLEIKQAH